VHFGGDVVKPRSLLIKELLDEALRAGGFDHFELDPGPAQPG